MLPSLGISLGGQFFVFFQVFYSFFSTGIGQNLPEESANKTFPINARCSLPTPVTTQTANKKAIESLQGEILSKNSILCFRFIMAEGAVYFGAVAGSYASGLCYAKFGYQVASPVSKFLHSKSLYTIEISTNRDFNWASGIFDWDSFMTQHPTPGKTLLYVFLRLSSLHLVVSTHWA